MKREGNCTPVLAVIALPQQRKFEGTLATRIAAVRAYPVHGPVIIEKRTASYEIFFSTREIGHSVSRTFQPAISAQY